MRVQASALQRAIVFSLAVLISSTAASDSTLSTSVNVDNGYVLYIATSNTAAGTTLSSGANWTTTISSSVTLSAGIDYYLHVYAYDTGAIAGFLGQFSLSGADHVFANGLTTLLTNATDWTGNSTGFNAAFSAVADIGPNDGTSPSWPQIPTIASAAHWIWVGDPWNGDSAYFTTKISATNPIAPPAFVSAVSRKVHGAAGPFDLPLSAMATSPTIEPRTGPAQTIVFAFDKPLTDGIATVTEGAATVGAPTFNGSEIIVPLTGVTNQQYVTVAVSNVTAADGGSGGVGSIRVGYLLGDVNQNRVVTLSDLGQVNAQVAQFVTETNYLKDVNVSGTLSLADKGITNTQITKALPAP